MKAARESIRRGAPQLSALIFLLVVNWVIFPPFFDVSLVDGRLTGSIIDVLNRAAPVALLSLGMAAVIATRGIDLSVGAIMAISGAVAASLVDAGHAWYVAVLCAIGAGLASGLWNGFLVSVLRIQPIVATLVLMVAGRGIAQLITAGQITTFTNPQLAALGSGALLGVPAPIIITVAVAAFLIFLARTTALGMFIEAIGTNPHASYLVGIRTRALLISVYACSGVTAAIAGVIVAADIRGADANNAGLWLELDAILAVVLGGASLLGGRLLFMMTLVGAVTLQALKTGILLAGFPSEFNLVVMAAVVSTLLVLQAPPVHQWWAKKIGGGRAVMAPWPALASRRARPPGKPKP
ncbi:MAG TPA: ABC transporter permease [Sphingomicrobium sp.]|nr:ABC transporter permease [Sphingomicrobium sp.]